MDLIYTNASHVDVGVVVGGTLDLAFGRDENNFVLTTGTELLLPIGGSIYIEGTEYGGVIDAVTVDTVARTAASSGRSWHGLLNSRIIEPPAGAAYRVVSGDANAIIGSLITLLGLSAYFSAENESSGITITDYQFNRYCGGYDGIAKLLRSVGAKLRIAYTADTVQLSAVSIADYSDYEVIDSSQLGMTITSARCVNHLICLGAGELTERIVRHLYIDGSGNIVTTPYYTGADEYAAVLDYPNAESADELIKSGRERLRELNTQGLELTVRSTDTVYDIGDKVGAEDVATHTSVTAYIAKKIVKITGDIISIEYEVTQ